MKKIYAILTAIIITMAFAACSSDLEDGMSGGKNRVKVNIKVGGMDGDEGTRAIKKGWEAGDKINIWFDGAYWNVLPQLVLTYDGTKWNASDVESSVLSAKGSFFAIYEASNSMFDSVTEFEYFYFPSKGVKGSNKCYCTPLSCYKNFVDYTFADNTITAEIDRWQFMTQIQVVVTGLAKSADKYALKINSVYDAPAYFYNEEKHTISPTGYAYSHFTIGMPNEDGVAFTFGSNTNGDVRDMVFTLKDLDTNEETIYTKKAVSLPTNGSSIKAIKIDGSKFEEEFKNKEYTVNGVKFTMVAVEGGTFTMGATPEQGSESLSDEKPAHDVTLSNYYIGQTEVTQELWEAVMGKNPSIFKGSNHPVEFVSWKNCQTFIEKLNTLTGEKFRLPTEAEWEYAARGGNKSKGYMYSGSNNIDDVAWYGVNSYDKGESSPDYGTHDVATKLPNELDIYDMTGNVYEWCQDWYEYYKSSAQTDPTGPDNGYERVYRGGGWASDAWYCRSLRRSYYSPGGSFNHIGLRLALPVY